MLLTTLRFLENTTLYDTVAKELIGINAPKIAFTRSKDECFDVAINELGNTAGLLGLGYAAHGIQNQFYRFAEPAARESKRIAFWLNTGKSLGVFSVIFSLMWAMPFVRNWYTAIRTGSIHYTKVIGAKLPPQKKSGKTPHPEKTAPYEYAEKLDEYKQKVGTIFSLGALGFAASLLGTSLVLAKLLKSGNLQTPLSKTLAFIEEKLVLKRGSFEDFGGYKAVLFWGVPAYAGWIDASRDKYERKEQILKFINFVVCFLGPQMLIGWWFKKRYAQFSSLTIPNGERITKPSIDFILSLKDKTPEYAKILSTKLKQEAIGLLASIGLLGVSPALLNWTLTQKRIDMDFQA